MTVSYAHFCGHIISNSGRFPKKNEVNVKKLITEHVLQKNISTCYGSLAAGADILVCEAVIENKGNIHIVLPFDKKSFMELSVDIAQDNWLNRFSSLIQQASSVTQVYQHKPVDENITYAICSEVAMGLCLYDTYCSSANPIQLAIWDQQKTDNFAGTFPDLLRWGKLGYESNFISSLQSNTIDKFLIDQAIDKVELTLQFTLKQTTYATSLIEVMSFIEQLLLLPIDSDLKIDLDNRVFGSNCDEPNTKIASKPISNRALGHILYHVFADNSGDELNSILTKINKLMTQG